MESLPLKIKYTAIKRALSLKAENHWNTQTIKSSTYQTNQEKIDQQLKEILKIDPNIKTDKITPTTLMDKSYTTKIDHRDDIKIKDCTNNLLIFTDGSKNDKGNTGYGITFSDDTLDEISAPLYSYNSIFQAEALALKRAAHTINIKNLHNINIEFYTDSQAVIKSLQKRITRNEIIKECHEILNSLGNTNNVTINWVPGHKGYEGNEIADKLAKAGAMKETNSDTYNKIPFNVLISQIKNHFNKTILNRYKNSGISSEAQIITNELLTKLENSTKKAIHLLLKLPTTSLSIIVKVLSNHNSLNYHQTTIKQA